MVINIPPHLRQKLNRQMEEKLPLAKEFWRQFVQLMGPVLAEVRDMSAQFGKKLMTTAGTTTLGNNFRHLAFVGLNRTELLLDGETQPIFGDNWQDVVNDNLKRHLALSFFAPRGLDGKPVNPYVFLMGEGTQEDSDVPDPSVIALAQQNIGNMALLDLCRIPPAAPNTVNVLLVADTIFHWDIKDNYVLPTTPTGWVRDLEQIIRSYPRTTRANLYTQWETDILPHSEKLTVHRLREFPLEPTTWINQPTLQEKYGGHSLVIGLIIAVATYIGLWYQQHQLDIITDQLNGIEQQIPRGGQFSDLERAITEQEKMWQRRDLFPLITKDTARAIQNSNMRITNFEVRVAEPNDPPVNYLVTVTAAQGAYQGWLQEEPIARSLVLNSALMNAIRKPPASNDFKLEAIINAKELSQEFKLYAPKAGAKVSSTQPVSATQPNGTNGKSGQ
jgi:hypothetical protein